MKKTKNPSEPTFKLTLDLELFALIEVQSIYPKHKEQLSSFNEINLFWVTLKIKDTLLSINHSQILLDIPWSEFS